MLYYVLYLFGLGDTFLVSVSVRLLPSHFHHSSIHRSSSVHRSSSIHRSSPPPPQPATPGGSRRGREPPPGAGGPEGPPGGRRRRRDLTSCLPAAQGSGRSAGHEGAGSPGLHGDPAADHPPGGGRPLPRLTVPHGLPGATGGATGPPGPPGPPAQTAGPGQSVRTP